MATENIVTIEKMGSRADLIPISFLSSSWVGGPGAIDFPCFVECYSGPFFHAIVELELTGGEIGTRSFGIPYHVGTVFFLKIRHLFRIVAFDPPRDTIINRLVNRINAIFGP